MADNFLFSLLRSRVGLLERDLLNVRTPLALRLVKERKHVPRADAEMHALRHFVGLKIRDKQLPHLVATEAVGTGDGFESMVR